MDPQLTKAMLLSFVIVLIVSSFLSAAITNAAAAGTSPVSAGKKKRPVPGSPEDEDFREFALDALLEKREDIYDAFSDGGLKGRKNVAEACERWRQYACREKCVSALALAAALCRLCPEDLPSGEPQARQGELLYLAGTGEGHFLLGLGHLSLYAHFHPRHESLARDAWRRAVEHFRLSGSAGSREGMEAAALLSVCGHDLPFTPPESFQEYLPLLKTSNTADQETFYGDLDIYTEDSDDGPSMHLYLPLDASSPSSREALFWNVRLAEAGDPLAMHYLATLYAGTEPPGMARAEVWYRRSMEAGNRSNAVDALHKLYLSGQLPDETGQKAAICLIFSACEEQCWEEDIPAGKSVKLTADDMAQLKGSNELASEVGRRAKAQLDACKAKGEALHAQARRNLLAWDARRRKETRSLLKASRQKLSVLCQNLERGKQPARQSATAAPRPDKRGPSRARPDKR